MSGVMVVNVMLGEVDDHDVVKDASVLGEWKSFLLNMTRYHQTERAIKHRFWVYLA